jgi:predicted amidohydrolase
MISMVRIAIIQLKPTEFSDDEKIEEVLNYFREAAEIGTNIVCLPEHWLSDSIEVSEKLAEVLGNAASTHKLHLISGANFENDKDRIFINSLVFNPEGKIIANQTKNHLFKNEKKVAIPGNDYSIFNFNDTKAGIMICYDAVFPEVARILALKGADIIFVPSRIRKDGIEAWHLYLRLRSLENRVVIAGINVADPPKYPGGSIIITPEKSKDSELDIIYPKISKLGGERPQMVVADLNFKSIRKMREDRLKDRRPEIYSDLTKPH